MIRYARGLWAVTLLLGGLSGCSRDVAPPTSDLLQHVPALIEMTLGLDPVIRELAERFAHKHHALFLGRGTQFPIAMEGALKLKEISYIPPRPIRPASSSTDRWRWSTTTCR